MGVITGDSVNKLVWPAPTGFALNCACVFVCVCMRGCGHVYGVNVYNVQEAALGGGHEKVQS